MLDCSCPGNTVLETIDYNPCKPIFNKDARWIFQRLDDANNLFQNGVNGIEEETSWASLPNAVDNTKVVITPRLEDVNFNQAEVLEDSENFDGAPFAIAPGAQLVTAMIRNVTRDQFKAIKSLACEDELTLYRIDAKGNFGARLVNTADHAGVQISPGTFVVVDPFRAGGRVDQYKLMIQFYLPSGWFDDFDIVAPEAGFNPLTEIRP
jgi:hypothetical protein